MKKCIDCKKQKSLKNFSFRRSPYGTMNPNGACKPCMSARMKAWKTKNFGYYNDYQKERRLEIFTEGGY